jgi:hypothetical protein
MVTGQGSDQCRNRYNKAVDDRDRITTVAELAADEFLKFRQRYYNKQLAMVVTTKNLNYTVHDTDDLIKDAVFRLPAGQLENPFLCTR